MQAASWAAVLQLASSLIGQRSSERVHHVCSPSHAAPHLAAPSMSVAGAALGSPAAEAVTATPAPAPGAPLPAAAAFSASVSWRCLRLKAVAICSGEHTAMIASWLHLKTVWCMRQLLPRAVESIVMHAAALQVSFRGSKAPSHPVSSGWETLKRKINRHGAVVQPQCWRGGYTPAELAA